jgi:hypothetical protein
MGKAVKSPTRIPAVAEDVSDRVSLETAGEMLIKHFANMHMACTRLDDAIRCAQVRLYAGEQPVSPDFFAGHLRVAVTVDGRLEICPTRAIDGAHVWAVRREEVLKLKEGAAPATVNDRGAGRRRKYVSDIELHNLAWAFVFSNGLPPGSDQKPTLEALCNALRLDHQDKVPRISRCMEILGPSWPAIMRAHNSDN